MADTPYKMYLNSAYDRRHWTGGSGPLSTGVGSFYNLILSNPVGSNIRAIIGDILLYSELKTEFADFRIQPTGNLPTTVRTMANAFIGGPAPACSLKIDVSTSALTGGTLSDFKVTIPPNNRDRIDLPPFIASPGHILGVSVPNTGGGAANLLAVVRWAEFPITSI